MKQWITHQDGMDKIQLVDAAEPTAADLKAGEVLVKINRVSLNYRDTEVTSGEYNHHKSLSSDSGPSPAIVPCSDMCGVVVAAGPPAPEVTASVPSASFQPGDRVLSTFSQSHLTGQVLERDVSSGMGLPLSGVLTPMRVFPATGLVRCPEGLTDEEAATLPIAAVTAWMSFNSFQPMGDPLKGAEKVVLLQGTGGVSVAAAQIAKKMGMTVIQTSSSDSKLARAKETLSVDHTINYRTTPNWSAEVMRLTSGRGADVILECGGASTLPHSFACVAFGGIIACIGYLSGKGPAAGPDGSGDLANVNVLALSRNVTLKGIFNGPRDRFEDMLRLVYSDSDVHPVVDRVFEFEEAPQAFQYIASGGHFGKVIIKVS